MLSLLCRSVGIGNTKLLHRRRQMLWAGGSCRGWISSRQYPLCHGDPSAASVYSSCPLQPTQLIGQPLKPDVRNMRRGEKPTRKTCELIALAGKLTHACITPCADRHKGMNCWSRPGPERYQERQLGQGEAKKTGIDCEHSGTEMKAILHSTPRLVALTRTSEIERGFFSTADCLLLEGNTCLSR